MTKMKKSFAALALAAGSVGIYAGGSRLLSDVRFARGEQANEARRDALQHVEDLSSVFRDVGIDVEPSVVQIEVHKTVKVPGGLRGFNFGDGGQSPGMEEVGTGSGVIMEVDGKDVYILTNNHVAGDATKMTVTLADGRPPVENGKLVGADPKSDLAVIKITADHVRAARWGDSDKLVRGDWVLAFGSPFGYVGSMTHGIVSALNRQAGILASVGGYENFIQVDAPINPGNSGGPLVNIHGEVVGINTAIASRSGGFQGIGFAIPSSQAKGIYAVLKEKHHVTRGWIGLKLDDVARDTTGAEATGFKGDHGVIIREVFVGTPGAGKLEPDDVITAVDGKPVTNVQELRNHIATLTPGTDVKLHVFRQGDESDVTVKLAEQPTDLASLDGGPKEAPAAGPIGLGLADVTPELAGQFGLGDVKGALVREVRPGSPAEAAQIEVGDVITRVGSTSVKSAADAVAALSKADISKGVRVLLTNKNGSRSTTLGGGN